MKSRRIRLLSAALVVCVWSQSAMAERTTLSLDGDWSIGESVGPDEIPASFDHTVAVPGLVNQAKPAFPDADHYETHEFVYTMKKSGVLPESDKCEGLGRTRQTRGFFWYERSFAAPAKKQSAILVVNKAQFGTAVWLNGRKVGEHMGCFTAGRFNVTEAMNWDGENRLIIRIGAHPGVLPDSALYGTDGEKPVWTPGIYDSVSLVTADNPLIESVQIAPKIDTSEILVQTRLKNLGPACTCNVKYNVKTWKGGKAAGKPVSQRVELAANEEKTIEQIVPVPDATLWSPDNPFLYVLDMDDGGDSCSTRFGMREFRCDTKTGRAMLNGKVIYLRGATITLHRFFGDPLCGGLPWDEAWVRKLLVEIPKNMHWNSFRICIGPAPQKWLDIADEAGLLLQHEFPIWSDREPFRHKLWKENEVSEQLSDFMRDNWNHPSIVIWDASNETRWDFLRETLIPVSRKLDLSNRPWDNGYMPPQDADDPWEDHPYLFQNHHYGKSKSPFKMTELETMEGRRKNLKPSFFPHAAIINEYEWLWLHRDGTPTILSRKVYNNLVGPNAAPEERRELYAYLLGGLTEFWRAYRNYAGVLYLAYLDGDVPTAFTCDNWIDPVRLELDPHFVDYMSQAFKPLGVYVNFWQPELNAGQERSYRVILVNDTYEPAKGKLELAWVSKDGGGSPPAAQRDFELSALGQMSCDMTLSAPTEPGKYILTVKAHWDGKEWSPAVARRKVTIVDESAK